MDWQSRTQFNQWTSFSRFDRHTINESFSANPARKQSFHTNRTYVSHETKDLFPHQTELHTSIVVRGVSNKEKQHVLIPIRAASIISKHDSYWNSEYEQYQLKYSNSNIINTSNPLTTENE